MNSNPLRLNTVAVIAAVLSISILMNGVSPESNTVAVVVWFFLLAVIVYNSIRVFASLLTIKWARLQSLAVTLAVLVLVALSSLRQLTPLDVLVVVLITMLAQLMYRVQQNC